MRGETRSSRTNEEVRLSQAVGPFEANAASIRDAEMVASGTQMCLVLHRSIRHAKEPKDCAMLAIKAGIPTYLIEDESATPRRIRIEDLL